MSKPIFIVRIPKEAIVPPGTYEYLIKDLPDYHVLVMRDSGVERVEFECHNAPHAASEFEELKKIVLKRLES